MVKYRHNVVYGDTRQF